MKYSLTPFHTFHLAANASKIVEFSSAEQLLNEWQTAVNNHQPVLILGQGSNVIFLDDFDGCVFINKLKGITHHEDEQFHYLHVQGGENWHELVKWTLANNIAGLENLALIPGVAGSAPIQNIGAYGVYFVNIFNFICFQFHAQSGLAVRRENIHKRAAQAEAALYKFGFIPFV